MSAGFGIESDLGADIAVLLQELDDATFFHLFDELLFNREYYLSVQINGCECYRAVRNGDAVDEITINEQIEKDSSEADAQLAYLMNKGPVSDIFLLHEVPFTENHSPGERQP